MLFGGFSPSGCKGRGWNFPLGPLEEVLKKIKGNGTALKKKGGGGAKTDTNKAREEIVAFCPRERGAGRFRAETGQEDLYPSRAVKIAYTTSALRTGGRKLCIFYAS